MARGEVESWVRAKDAARAEAFSDGEDNNRWSPRLKAPGETFSMEGGATGRRRSSTIMDQAAEALCCCGPRWGRKYNAVNEPTNPSDGGLRTKGRWEVNEDDEYFKPPVWKQLILKVKAQARQANCSNGGNGNEWVNYDAESYEKNFDNGTWRDSSRDLVYHDQENEKLGLKDPRALHTALLHKLASSRSSRDGEQVQVNTLSPLPVNHRSPPKPKDEFVPIWQRRASSPVTLDVRQRS